MISTKRLRKASQVRRREAKLLKRANFFKIGFQIIAKRNKSKREAALLKHPQNLSKTKRRR